MYFFITITIGLAGYVVFCLILCRCMSINELSRRRAPVRATGERRAYTERRTRIKDVKRDLRQDQRRRGWIPLLNNQNGAVIILVALMLGTVLIPMLALALNTGIIVNAKTRAAAVADSIALAAASALYPPEELPRPSTCTPGPAQQAGTDMMQLNGLGPNGCTHELGHWTGTAFIAGALGNIPIWETVSPDELLADIFFTNAAQVSCTVTPGFTVLNWPASATAHAIAMHRMEEATPPDTGTVITPGSCLVK